MQNGTRRRNPILWRVVPRRVGEGPRTRVAWSTGAQRREQSERLLIPKDLLDEIASWTRHAKTGSLEITFQDGAIKKLIRREDITPAPVVSDEITPCCSGSLVNRSDFGAKGECARCGRAWSIWAIRRMRKQVEDAA